MKNVYFGVIAVIVLLSHSCAYRSAPSSSPPTRIFTQPETITSTNPPVTQTILPGPETPSPSPDLIGTPTPVTVIQPTETKVFERYQVISVGNAQSAQIVYELQSSSSKTGKLLGLEFSPIGGTLAVVTEPGGLDLWQYPIQGANISIKDFQLNMNQYGEVEITTVAFRPDGDILAAGTSSGLLLNLNPITGKILSQAATDLKALDMEYSPDGSILAIIGYKSLENKYVIQLWDVANMQLTATLDDFPRWYGAICSLAISSDGEVLAAGFCDYHIKAWDINNEYRPLGSIIGQYAFECFSHCPSPTNRIAFMPKSTILASGTDNPGIPLIDVSTGKLALGMDTARTVQWTDPTTGRTSYPVSASNVTDIAFSPDGTVLAIAAWSEIQLRSTKTNEMLAFFETPKRNGATKIAFSTDGLLIAVGTNQGYIYIIGAKDSVNRE